MSRYNYFDEISVDGYSFPATPQVDFGFLSTGISFLNRGTSVLEYSFDGETVHGDSNPGDESGALTFDNRVESVIWFRGQDGYGDMRVEAWGMSGR